jgi:hypothetical protein
MRPRRPPPPRPARAAVAAAGAVRIEVVRHVDGSSRTSLWCTCCGDKRGHWHPLSDDDFRALAPCERRALWEARRALGAAVAA